MVKSIAKNLQRTLLRSFKVLLVLVLFATFYLLFALTEPELLRASRTAASGRPTMSKAGRPPDRKHSALTS